jgi:hypothetical protein
MKQVLAVTAMKETIDLSLVRVAGRVRVHFFMTKKDLLSVLSLDNLDVYDIILIAPFDWRLPHTANSLTAKLRLRFPGPIVAISSLREWGDNAVAGGADHAVSRREATQLIETLLFPPT